jgi:hypothetical protein
MRTRLHWAPPLVLDHTRTSFSRRVSHSPWGTRPGFCSYSLSGVRSVLENSAWYRPPDDSSPQVMNLGQTSSWTVPSTWKHSSTVVSGRSYS